MGLLDFVVNGEIIGLVAGQWGQLSDVDVEVVGVVFVDIARGRAWACARACLRWNFVNVIVDILGELIVFGHCWVGCGVFEIVRVWFVFVDFNLVVVCIFGDLYVEVEVVDVGCKIFIDIIWGWDDVLVVDIFVYDVFGDGNCVDFVVGDGVEFIDWIIGCIIVVGIVFVDVFWVIWFYNDFFWWVRDVFSDIGVGCSVCCHIILCEV